MTTLHHSRRLLKLSVHTFCGWVYLVQTARFTILIFGWVDLLYRNFDDCIYFEAEATTVITFALDVTMLFCKLPCFGQFLMMKKIMFYLVI